MKVRSRSRGRYHDGSDVRGSDRTSDWIRDVASSSAASGSSRRASERASNNGTVTPEDSISMVSSKRSKGGWSGSGASATRMKIYQYPRSGYSQRDDERFEDDGVEVSNGKFVKERRPEWVY